MNNAVSFAFNWLFFTSALFLLGTNWRGPHSLWPSWIGRHSLLCGHHGLDMFCGRRGLCRTQTRPGFPVNTETETDPEISSKGGRPEGWTWRPRHSHKSITEWRFRVFLAGENLEFLYANHCTVGSLLKSWKVMSSKCRIRSSCKAYITIAIRLRYDYDTTTTKNWHVHFLLASNGSRCARYVVVGS